jgi:hypothetical protein
MNRKMVGSANSAKMKLSTQPIDRYTSGLLKESDERVENILSSFFLLPFYFCLVTGVGELKLF